LFRTIRIALLLIVLVGVAASAWLTKLRTTSWERPLRVAVFPINADGSPDTARYIEALSVDSFRSIADFMTQEAQRYELALQTPVDLFLAPQIQRVPPPPPFGGNIVQVMLWSLQLRYWVWVNAEFAGPKPHVRMLVLYFDPQHATRVAHSLGLQKGLIGVVNAFATRSQNAQNNIVIAHELLHTVGATDKYDPATNQPLYPQGYAAPEQQPLLPQRFAEIMGGRVPLTQADAEMPDGLEQVLIGADTAREIRWLK